MQWESIPRTANSQTNEAFTKSTWAARKRSDSLAAQTQLSSTCGILSKGNPRTLTRRLDAVPLPMGKSERPWIASLPGRNLVGPNPMLYLELATVLFHSRDLGGEIVA